MNTNKITTDNVALAIFMNANSTPKTEIPWIMNAQGEQLITMVSSFLTELDHLQQLAGDAGDEDICQQFSEVYTQVEQFYWLAKINNTMRLADREELRSLVKLALKTGGMYYC